MCFIYSSSELYSTRGELEYRLVVGLGCFSV
jgi:hypothetical protein